METAPILAPAAVLVLWSILVLLYLVTTRFAAFSKAGISLGSVPAGSQYADVESDMPAKVNWVSHNYTHLMEQPTLFYAVVAVLALAGDTSSLSLGAAWVYTGSRIAHSVWQIFVNVVAVRVVLFTIGTVCLLILGINAVQITLL